MATSKGNERIDCVKTATTKRKPARSAIHVFFVRPGPRMEESVNAIPATTERFIKESAIVGSGLGFMSLTICGRPKVKINAYTPTKIKILFVIWFGGATMSRAKTEPRR